MLDSVYIWVTNNEDLSMFWYSFKSFDKSSLALFCSLIY